MSAAMSAFPTATGLCLLLAIGCGSESAGGPELAELETVVEDLANHPTNPRCTELPVLLGGRARDEIDVAGEFSILVEATHTSAWVSFAGIEDADQQALVIPVEELRRGYSEHVEVVTLRGRQFLVDFDSECAR